MVTLKQVFIANTVVTILVFIVGFIMMSYYTANYKFCFANEQELVEVCLGSRRSARQYNPTATAVLLATLVANYGFVVWMYRQKRADDQEIPPEAI